MKTHSQFLSHNEPAEAEGLEYLDKPTLSTNLVVLSSALLVVMLVGVLLVWSYLRGK